MKKLFSLTAALLALALTLTACGKQEQTTTPDDDNSGDAAQTEPYLIGISQYGEHASLDNCRIGFLQGLEQAVSPPTPLWPATPPPRIRTFP